MTLPDPTHDPAYAAELLRRAAELEAEANAVVAGSTCWACSARWVNRR